jgi:Phosphate-selective porin O and P
MQKICKRLMTIRLYLCSLVLLSASHVTLCAQVTNEAKLVERDDNPPVVKSSHWYEKIAFRGYGQIRYNRLLETNEKLKCDQCDRSWGENGGFSIRRLRTIFQGDVHDKVYIYLQADWASDNKNLLQIRDAYFDLAIDKDKEYRFRIGQSKVPYGFENMQSSQNRLALDRSDPMNSAVANERDLGIFFYYAPKYVRERFKTLVADGLKGSGDYGMLGVGAYNGQIANALEANNEPHVVARVSYPFKFTNGQYLEGSLQAYTGQFVTTKTATLNKTKTPANLNFTDKRAAATIVLYPQPFGFQAEYNIGEGPEFDPETMTTVVKPLKGGYVQAMYMQKIGKHIIIPFVRYQTYEGAKKHEIDATRQRTQELEIGAEWQPHKNFELVTQYTISNRTFENATKPVNAQSGNLLRIQAQVNF